MSYQMKTTIVICAAWLAFVAAFGNQKCKI